MKKRLTLNTVAEPLRVFPPLSQRCALRAGERPLRGGAALAREPWRGPRQLLLLRVGSIAYQRIND